MPDDRDAPLSRHRLVRLEWETRAHLLSVYSIDHRYEIGCVVRLDLNDDWPLFEIIALEGDALVLRRVTGPMPSR